MRVPQRLTIVFAFIFSLSLAAVCQNAHIVIPAGSPEDKALAAIAAEGDAGKRTEAYEEFIKKYADNKPAVAYAEWQLSQDYLTAHDNAKALEWGDKALETLPNDLDIVVSDCNVAMALKDNGKIVDYAVKGAAVCNSIAQQTKPPDVSDGEWKNRIAEQENAAKPSCDFLETAAYNAIASEQNASKRMDYIEKFTPAFPKSQFDQQVSQLAMLSLQQLNQPQRLAAYGEKALAAKPDSIPTLLMLANAYAGDPKQAAKAATYANKVVALVGPNPADNTAKSYAGLAHTALGRADLNQEKLPAATTELKIAVALLQHDPPDQQVALYYLGYAAAKQNRKADSIAALEKAAAIDGPYRAPAKEMLAKVEAAGKK
jgi:tetratricopeptide (TPR) repeat protein